LWTDIQQLTWQKRLTFLYRVLFPSRTYMQHRYQIKPRQAVLPYYPYRWLDQTREVLWTIMGRIRYRLSRYKTPS
jgi:hypothetical protein